MNAKQMSQVVSWIKKHPKVVKENNKQELSSLIADDLHFPVSYYAVTKALKLQEPAQRPEPTYSVKLVETSALDKQAGGSHYKEMVIQPIEYIFKNKLGYIEGNVIKYISRWQSKGGVADLEKAKHYIEMLIEMQPR